MTGLERQSNIELARICAIAGVFILHYNNTTLGGGIMYAKGINLVVIYILESTFACAVNLFMIISGYFLSQKKRVSIWKPLKLIIQVIAFSFGLYLLRGIISGRGITIKGIIGSLIPANYFVILYSTVYVLSPYINKLLQSVSPQQRRIFVLVLMILFSAYPTAVDIVCELIGHQWIGLSTVGAYGSQWGYSIVNFILMYIIGAFLKTEEDITANIKTKWLVMSFIVCVLIMSIWARINDYIGYLTERTAWEYCNPVPILSAVCAFLLFSRLNIGTNHVINTISNSVFSMYLLHSVFLSHIGVEQAVKGNLFLMLGHMVLSTVLVYFICFLAHYIYSWITTPVFEKLEKRICIPNICLED